MNRKDISSITKTKYNEAVLKIFNTQEHSTALGPFIIAFLIWIGIVKIVPLICNMTKLIGILILLSLPILTFICVLIYTKKVKEESFEVIDTNDIYMNDILRPIISEIDKNAIVDNFPNQAPLYGKLNLKDNKDVINGITNNPHPIYKDLEYQNMYNILSPHINDKNFGKWLSDNRVIPKFDLNFYMSLYINTLLSNNGIWFTNAKATSMSGEESNTKTVFKGIILAIQIPNNLDYAVNIYTTKNMLNQELNNGYKKSKNIIDTENVEFNNNFDVISDDTIKAFYILTPLCIEKLLKLKEKYKNFGIYIYKNCMYIGINSNEYILDKEIIINNTLEPLSFDDYMANVYKFYEIAEDFRGIFNGTEEF